MDARTNDVGSGSCVISLEGELLQHDAPRVTALLELAGGSKAVIVDCSDVTRMHGAIIAALVSYARKHPHLGLSVILRTKSLRRVFELTGASRFMRIR
jgi:anti-anti-sigma regulatory factor